MVSVACSMNKSVCSLRTRCPSVLVGRTQCRPTLSAALTPITLSLTSLAGQQAILCGARHGGCKLLLADHQAIEKYDNLCNQLTGFSSFEPTHFFFPCFPPGTSHLSCFLAGR